MDDADRYRLLFGPYAAPAWRRGEPLECEARGESVRVGGLHEAPIPWPRALKTGHHSLIVCGDLARAVRAESVQAVAYHWGVSPTTVWAWRKALGVGPMTEGTTRLYRDYQPEKLDEVAYAKMAETARTPGAREAQAALKRGRPAHPNTRKALRRAAKRKKLAAHRRSIAAALARHSQAKPRPRPVVRPGDRPWTARDDRLLGTTLDRIVAGMIGRTIPAVRSRRKALNIPASRHADLHRSPRP